MPRSDRARNAVCEPDSMARPTVLRQRSSNLPRDYLPYVEFGSFEVSVEESNA
jgi:hypothetical protein